MSGITRTPTSGARATLRRHKTVVLTTFKWDGTGVPTPVNIAFDGERIFFRSFDRAWKTKRIRNRAEVEVTPATFRGTPDGEAIPARAALLEDEAAQPARRALRRSQPVIHGLVVPLIHRLKRYRTMHYELHLAGVDDEPLAR
jgi:uncharacterized protein